MVCRAGEERENRKEQPDLFSESLTFKEKLL